MSWRQSEKLAFTLKRELEVELVHKLELPHAFLGPRRLEPQLPGIQIHMGTNSVAHLGHSGLIAVIPGVARVTE